MSLGTIYFCFPNPSGFSGQKAATEMVIKGLSGRGWTCRRLPQPVLERSGVRLLAKLRHCGALLAAWMRAFVMLGARGGWLCVNLGQTRSAILRDTFTLLIGSLSLGRERTVVSLHGSLFMRWSEHSLEARWFRFLLGRAGRVTVLGENQRERLLGFGVPESRTAVLINSCTIEPVSIDAVRKKHGAAADGGRPVRCLHLSSLIDAKGFPEYLEALRRLSAADGPAIDAVLCGRLIESEFTDRFHDIHSAEQWIGDVMEETNRSSRMRVRWINGATGTAKETLFREADLFILPTHYAVEAQPIVLLEAMASGCAIITTRTGEIPTILDEQTAVFLREISAQTIATAIETLAQDRATRTGLALAAHARFLDCYQIERHLDSWEALLKGMGSSSQRT